MRENVNDGDDTSEFHFKDQRKCVAINISVLNKDQVSSTGPRSIIKWHEVQP